MDVAILYKKTNEKESIRGAIEKFIKEYSEKYHVVPNKCHVNKVQFDANKKEFQNIDNIEIVSDKSILNDFFWIGDDSLSLKDYLNIKLERRTQI